MTGFINKLAQALPALLGVLAGIYIYDPGGLWLGLTTLAFVLAWLAMKAGTSLLKERPMLGWFLVELWVFAAISVLAASTALILWVTVHADALVATNEDSQQAVSGALVGAVTAFLAILWTKDIESGTGYFWPSTRLKTALRTRFDSLKPEDDADAHYAVFRDKGRDASYEGWGLAERFKRVKLVQKYVSKAK